MILHPEKILIFLRTSTMSWIYHRSIAIIGMRVVSLLTPALTARYQNVFMTSLGAGSAG